MSDLSRLTDLQHAVRRVRIRFGGWPRRALVAACLVLAAASALSGTRAHAGDVAVVVARHDLAAGHVVTAGDVALRRWQHALLPSQVVRRIADIVGRSTAGVVTAGEALTQPRLVGSGLLAGQPPGTVAVAVRVDVASAQIIRAGERIDLVIVGRRPEDLSAASADAPARSLAPITVARSVLVLRLAGADGANPAEGDVETYRVVTVAVDTATAVALTSYPATPFLATLRAR